MNGHEPSGRWHALKIGALRAKSWLLAAGLLLLGAQAAYAEDYECRNAVLPTFSPSDLRDLKVTGTCLVQIGVKSYFANVNIVDGGILVFRESDGLANSQTDFWASSIIIENRGQMSAFGAGGVGYGFNGGTLTIHLYGKNEAVWNAATETFTTQNLGTVCKSGPNDNFGKPQGPCGVDLDIWNSNGSKEVMLPINDDKNLPITDYFYQYGPLRGDGRCTDGSVFANGKCGAGTNPAAMVGYFGNKVLAVSFGGDLNLNGYKGATPSDEYGDVDPLNSGTSWMRLSDGHSLPNEFSLPDGSSLLLLEREPRNRWQAGDEVVLTTTDYLPGHSEKLKISNNYRGGAQLPFKAIESRDGKIRWPHNGVRSGGYADPNRP
jgi:cell migration-inducing and hyaluronan-binding protein